MRGLFTELPKVLGAEVLFERVAVGPFFYEDELRLVGYVPQAAVGEAAGLLQGLGDHFVGRRDEGRACTAVAQ